MKRGRLLILAVLALAGGELRGQDAGGSSSNRHVEAVPGSASRYDREFVFPLRMRNISLGASPALWREFTMPVNRETDRRTVLPPIHLTCERAMTDMGNAGSLGWGFQLGYGRYGYNYLWNDGYGDREVHVRAGRFEAMAGLSYHYTIATRFEAYARAMAGAGITGYRGDRSGDADEMDARFQWNAVAGARYFFTRSFGVYAEGGYTAGIANAGLTYRW
ncbi:MAG: hypothetical protein LBH06_08975 [Rikenellaceae bacterium]|jgi:hypothetical protein|nr:hypothetical protein [Rikenellaceae bacterium]